MLRFSKTSKDLHPIPPLPRPHPRGFVQELSFVSDRVVTLVSRVINAYQFSWQKTLRLKSHLSCSQTLSWEAPDETYFLTRLRMNISLIVIPIFSRTSFSSIVKEHFITLKTNALAASLENSTSLASSETTWEVAAMKCSKKNTMSSRTIKSAMRNQ